MSALPLILSTGSDYDVPSTESRSLPQGAVAENVRFPQVTTNASMRIVADYVHRYGNGLLTAPYSTNLELSFPSHTTTATLALAVTPVGSGTIAGLTVDGNAVTYAQYGNATNLNLSGVSAPASVEPVMVAGPKYGTGGYIQTNATIQAGVILDGAVTFFRGDNAPSNASIRVSSPDGPFYDFSQYSTVGVMNSNFTLPAGAFFVNAVTFTKGLSIESGHQLPNMTLSTSVVQDNIAVPVDFDSLEDTVSYIYFKRGTEMPAFTLPFFSVLSGRYVLPATTSVTGTAVTNSTNDTRILFRYPILEPGFILPPLSSISQIVVPSASRELPRQVQTLNTQQTPYGMSAPEGVTFPSGSSAPAPTILPADLRFDGPNGIDNDTLIETGSLLTAGSSLAAGSQSFPGIRSATDVTIANTILNAPYTLTSNRNIPGSDGTNPDLRIEPGTIFPQNQTFPSGTHFYNGVALPGRLEIPSLAAGFTTMNAGTVLLEDTILRNGFRLPGDSTIFSNPVHFPPGTVIGGEDLTLPAGTVIPPGFVSPGGGAASNLPNGTLFPAGSSLPTGFQFAVDTPLINIHYTYFNTVTAQPGQVAAGPLSQTLIRIDGSTSFSYYRLPAGSIVRKDGAIPAGSIATQQSGVLDIIANVPSGGSSTGVYPRTLQANEWRTSPPVSQADHDLDFAVYQSGANDYTTPIPVNIFLNVDYLVLSDILIPTSTISHFLQYVNLPFPVELNQSYTLPFDYSIPIIGQFVWPANTPLPVEIVLTNPLVLPAGTSFSHEIVIGGNTGTTTGLQPAGGYIQFPEYTLVSEITLGADISVAPELTASVNFNSNAGLSLPAGHILNMTYTDLYGYAIPSSVVTEGVFVLSSAIDSYPAMVLRVGTILPAGSHLLGDLLILAGQPFPEGVLLTSIVILSQDAVAPYDLIVAADSTLNTGSILAEGTLLEEGLIFDSDAYLFPVFFSPARFVVLAGFIYPVGVSRPQFQVNNINIRVLPVIMDNLDQIIAGLEQSSSEHTFEIGQLQTQIALLQGQIAALQTQLPEDVSELQIQLNQQLARIIALENAVFNP